MPTGPSLSNSTSFVIRHLQKSGTPNPGLRIGSLFSSRTPGVAGQGFEAGAVSLVALGAVLGQGKLRRYRASHPVVEPSALPTVSTRSFPDAGGISRPQEVLDPITGETADKAYRRSISLRRFPPRIISFSALDKPMASICSSVSFIHSSPCWGPKG